MALLLLAFVSGIPTAHAQTVIFSENFDNATGAPGYLPYTWTTSHYFLATGSYSGDDPGSWGRDWQYGYTQSYNGTTYYYYYPEGYPPYAYAYSYFNGTYNPPSHSNSGSPSTAGYMWYGTYESNPGSWGEATTPSINFASTYTGTGGFILSFWVWEINQGTSYNNKLDVYINSSPTSTGATQIGSDIYPQQANVTTGQWVNYSYTLPATYNTSSGVYIIFRAAMGNSYNNYDIFVDDVSVTYVPPCNGTPSAPTITTSAMATAVCPGSSFVLSASDPNITPAISYNWQSSLSATGPWTNVTSGTGVGTLNYTCPGITDTTYFRLVDSCQNSHINTPSTNVFKVPVIKYYLPYQETFNTTANNSAPPCYTYNDNYGTNWTVITGLHAADHTLMNGAMRAGDPASNAAHGKNDFFTVPGFTLTGSQVYAVRFKYARGRQDAVADTGNLYPEHLQVYANTPSPGYSVTAATSGTLIFDQTITFNNIADTTLYFAPTSTGSYYFTWYSNTAHPNPTANPAIPGGHVIVDSIYIAPATCVSPTIASQPTVVNGCIGGSASLTVNATGTANTYQWYKGSTAITGATSAALNKTALTYSDSGMYSVVVTNPCGTVTSNNIDLVVNPLPNTTVTPSGSTTFCAGTNFTLFGPVGTGYQYVWKTSGTPNGVTSANYQPTASGSYSVTVTSGVGCVASSNNISVTVNPVPTAAITPSGPTSFCFGDSVTLIATTGAGLTYQWYQNNFPIPPGFGGTNVSFQAKGSFASGVYKVAVSNGTCTTTSSTVTVSATAPPPATITSNGGNSICSGTTLTLTANSGTGYKYQWLYNGNNVSDTNNTYAVSSAGSYAVKVTSGSCSSTSSNFNVSVLQSPPAYIAASSTFVCTGGYVALNADTGNTATSYTYQWFKGGILQSNTTYTDTITTSGNYYVTVGNSNGCYTTSPITPISVATPPPAVITTTGSDTACAGNTVTLTANAGPGYLYQWLGKNAGIISGATGQYYQASATDTYKVAVTNLYGCVDTTTVGTGVVINALPTISITSTGSNAFCPGGSATLSASPGAGSGLTYLWYFNGVSTGVTTPTYAATATGNVTVQATNTSNCSAISAPVSTTLNTPPTASIQASGPLNFCPGSNVVLSTPTSAAYSYLWKDKAGTVLSITSSYTATTTDSIEVKVTDNTTNCAGTSSFGSTPYIGVTLNSSPAATAAAIGGTTICAGNSVTLAADTNSSAGITYQWKQNGSVLGGATAPTYIATSSGNYVVVTSNGNCTTTSSPITITVNPAPSAVITPLSNPIICSNQFVTLSATTAPGDTYQWLRNSNPIYTTGATSPNYTTDTAGNYTVKVTTSLGCSSTSTVTTVTVYATPTVTIVPITATSVCQGDTVKLYAHSTNSNVSYKWLVGTTTIPSAINPNFSTVASGAYSVIVTNGNNCSDTAAVTNVTVNPAPTPVVAQHNSTLSTGTYNTYQWYYNNTPISGARSATYNATQLGNYSVYVTDNNGCVGMSPVLDVTSLTTGVNNVAHNDDIKLYPNPTTSIVHIIAPIQVNARISGIDGKLLIQAQHVNEIDLSQLANGVYTISLYDNENNLIKIDKLVKAGW